MYEKYTPKHVFWKQLKKKNLLHKNVTFIPYFAKNASTSQWLFFVFQETQKSSITSTKKKFLLYNTREDCI